MSYCTQYYQPHFVFPRSQEAYTAVSGLLEHALGHRNCTASLVLSDVKDRNLFRPRTKIVHGCGSGENTMPMLWNGRHRIVRISAIAPEQGGLGGCTAEADTCMSMTEIFPRWAVSLVLREAREQETRFFLRPY